MINVFQPALREEELEAVREVFESNWVGRGRRTAEFEERFAEHLGTDRALVRSISSCTEGMFQAMTLLDIGPGDEVVLPTISFVGAGNAVAASGAQPVFCDVDPRTLNARAEDVERVLSPRTKAVLVLHYGGLPCDVDGIGALAAEHGFAVIEDSACSVSSRHAGRACGTFGDVATWSFDAMKILVCGDGGMIHCRTPELAERAERLLYLGLETQSGLANTSGDRWWEFEVSESARRSIMNDVASAIGLVQLGKLPAAIERRRQVHERYDAELAAASTLCIPLHQSLSDDDVAQVVDAVAAFA